MSRIARMLAAAVTAIALLTMGVPSPSTSQNAAARASLTITPGSYVGGQKLTYTGSIGVRGRHRVKLQYHMNRPGDSWTDVVGFRGATTDAAGRFRFTFPAPAMWGISYRVVSGRHATPRHTFHAKSQEVTLVAGNNNRVVAGRPFDIVVDTAPSQKGRADLPPPIIPGRRVVLQQRVNGDRWKPLADTTTNRDGIATFRGRQVGDPGTVVYRAVEGDWTKDGHRIGWFPSFPTYVEVVRAGAPRQAVPRSPVSDASRVPSPRAAGSPNASQNYGWGRSLFDFAWEFGESLTSRPHRGTRLRGRWVDASNGSGRANHINGGLGLDSRFGAQGGPGDVGTTRVTLRGNAQRYGRWEVRGRSWSRESSAKDFKVKIELVPDRAQDYRCGGQNITVAEYRIHDRSIRVGAKALRGKRSWSLTKRSVPLEDASHNFGVEVAKDHITWFLDGRPLATLKSRAAVSDVPLTLRLSLEGEGTAEMNRTRSIFDWQRAWPMGSGRQVRSGHRLTPGTYSGGC